jgi:hypothetical protein
MSNETLSKPGMDRYYWDTVWDNVKAAAALYSTVVWGGCDDASNEKKGVASIAAQAFQNDNKQDMGGDQSVPTMTDRDNDGIDGFDNDIYVLSWQKW